MPLAFRIGLLSTCIFAVFIVAAKLGVDPLARFAFALFSSTERSAHQVHAAKTAEKPAPISAVGTISEGEYIAPFEGLNVRMMVEQADLIVVGRIVHVEEPIWREFMASRNDKHCRVCLRSRELADAMSYSITVDRIVKGDRAAFGEKIKVRDYSWQQSLVDTPYGVRSFPNPKIPMFRGIPQLTYGIFALKQVVPGKFDFVDLDHPVLPASPALIAESGSRAPLQMVASELAHVLETPLAVLNERGGELGGESGGGSCGDYTISSGELLYRDAVSVLTQLPKEVATPAFKSVAARSESSLSKLWTCNGLVSLGDWTQWSQAKQLLLNPAPEVRYAARMIVQDLADNIQGPNGVQFSRSVPTALLKPLLQSRDGEIREAAECVINAKKNYQAHYY